MFTIEDIRERVGGAEAFQRVLGLSAKLVKRSPNAVAAQVDGFDAMVSGDLSSRCTCKSTGLCDHAAAAALEWILEGDGRELVPYHPTPRPRFT